MKKVFYVIVLFLLAGCGKFLDDYSQDLVIVKKVSDLDEILLGSVYLPSKEVPEINQGGVAWWLHLLDDDVNTVIEKTAARGRVEMEGVYFGYTTWQMEVGRSYSGGRINSDNGVWNELYQRINAVNIVLSEIDGLDQTQEKDRLAALRIKGECHFLRAQFYLTLVNIYADMYTPENASTTLGVPLKLTHFVEHDKNKETQFDRNPVGEVYEQILKDLNSSVKFFKESPQIRPLYRANKAASLLLLSRVYLYMQDWENAKKAAAELLDINRDLMDYSAIANNGTVISDGNPEVIFSQSCSNLQSAFTGRGGDFCVSNDLYSIYEDDDYRKNLFFLKAFSSDSIALGRKYERGLNRSNYSDLFMLRNAEAYLNMAEACSMTNDAAGASKWLNLLRKTRIENYQNINYDVNSVIDEVRSERRKELCLEGHRWFDLRRYAVSKKAPFSKMIERVFALYNWDDKNILKYAEIYQLLPGDRAYTFAIPKAVLDFDIGMPDNVREVRKLNRLY